MIKSLFIIMTLGLGIFANPASAQTSLKTAGESGLPIPRFVSIKADIANARRGPGDEYPILWQYRSPNYPLMVIDEYRDWRRVRDYLGDESWMKHWLLSGNRYVAIISDVNTPLRARANANANIVGYAPPTENNARPPIAKLDSCEGAWCKIKLEDIKGWIERAQIWGVQNSD